MTQRAALSWLPMDDDAGARNHLYAALLRRIEAAEGTIKEVQTTANIALLESRSHVAACVVLAQQTMRGQAEAAAQRTQIEGKIDRLGGRVDAILLSIAASLIAGLLGVLGYVLVHYVLK